MYSYGSPHMAEQKQDNQLEHTFSSYMRIRDVALKNCQGRWTIGKSVPYSQLTLCAKWTYNVHYCRIYKEHRNLGIRKHVTTSCSGTKPFYQLWVKGFDVRRRDTIFYAVLFIWPPTREPPSHRVHVLLASASSKIDPSRLASSTRLFLSSNSHTTSARFRCMASPAPCHPVSAPSPRTHPR